MNLIEKYLGESKMGKLPQKIERTAYIKDYPAMLKWELIDPEDEDQRVNYKIIGDTAWKEASTMRSKGIIGFYEDGFNINSVHGLGPNKGQISYEATVNLIKFDEKKLKQELRKLKFRIK